MANLPKGWGAKLKGLPRKRWQPSHRRENFSMKKIIGMVLSVLIISVVFMIGCASVFAEEQTLVFEKTANDDNLRGFSGTASSYGMIPRDISAKDTNSVLLV